MNRSLKIIVVGGVAAGPSAAAKAKRTNPAAEVVLYEAGDDVSYGTCEMPYLLSGELSSAEDLVLFTPDQLASKKQITVNTRHRVESIHPVKRTVNVLNLRTGERITERYDRLILATGASPKKLSGVPDTATNCFHFTSLSHTRSVLRFVDKAHPSSVCIVGAGYIGLEVAEALRKRGLTVTLLYDTPLPFPAIDPPGQHLIGNILSANAIELVPNAHVTGASVHGSTMRALQTSAGEYHADMFIIAAGITPNTRIAREAGITTGLHGGILTDQRQMTNVDGIYAAGDCTEVLNLTTRKTECMPFATLASKTGRVAGENAAGGAAAFKGAVPVSAMNIFGYEIAQAGTPSEELQHLGHGVVQTHVMSTTRVGFMPGAEPLLVSMTADRRTQRLLNANIIAKEQAAMRMNAVAMAIRHNFTLDTFIESDFVYTPRLAPLWDPLNVCAQQLLKKLSR